VPNEGKSETAVNWNDIWVAVQEMGAALRPVFDLDPIPRWALRLRAALDFADPKVERLCEEVVDVK
jgi:hypothetical protein